MNNTNIPFEHCKFRSQPDIFWKVEILKYDDADKSLNLKVTDYFLKDVLGFESQQAVEGVQRITFEKFDWIQLEKHLFKYTKIKLLDVLENPEADIFPRGELKTKSFSDLSDLMTGQRVSISATPYVAKPFRKTINKDFSIYFSESRFISGNVTFSKWIKEVGGNVDFTISNDFIRPEFDSIKSWFAKKLQRKFKVFATIVTQDFRLAEVSASSPEIDLINSDLVESIKQERIVRITKPRTLSEGSRALFTSDEVFQQVDSADLHGNLFRQTEQEILTVLLNKHQTRNRKQLEYLSGSKQSKESKLRFTLHPHFGFLFFIEGKQDHHFVWELLDSHATYIWSFKNDNDAIGGQYDQVENQINVIRSKGREEYKRTYRESNPEPAIAFSVVDHHDITSAQVDGFVKWRQRIDERLT